MKGRLMSGQEREIPEVLTNQLCICEPGERGAPTPHVPMSEVPSTPVQVPTPRQSVKRVRTRRTARKNEKLPRGIRRRKNSLVVFLTHADGHGERRSVGNISVKMATQQRDIWQRAIAEGRYLKKVPRVEPVAFSIIADKAVENFKIFTRSWDATEGRVKLFKEWWGNREANTLTTEEIQRKLLEKTRPLGKWSQTTYNEYRLTLLRIFALARKQVDNYNPAIEVTRFKLENARERELTFAEEDRLRAAILKKYPRKVAEFDLALHLMCRRSNLYGQHNSKRRPMQALQWNDVNLDFRIANFRRSKSGKSYRVPINDTALAALKELRARGDGTGAVIRKPSGIELQSCRKWFENCLKDAKIADFHWHDLRHTAASRLREANAHIEDIRYLLGHGAKSITERYAHPQMSLLRTVIAKLDRKPNAEVETDTKTDTSAVVEFQKVAG